MRVRKYPQLKFGIALAMGAIIALVLCVQCVRTYWYTEAVLVPQQAEHEAVRQAGALSAATRSAGITDPRGLGPVMEHALDAASDRVLWMRLLDLDSNVLAQRGSPQGKAQVPPHWWDRVEKHERPDTLVDTPEGKALVIMLPLRIPRPPHSSDASGHNHQSRPGVANSDAQSGSVDSRARPPDDRHTAYVLELAISLKAVASAFEGLRQNLIVGLIASIALLVSVGVIALRAPHYFRGQYLENELELARRVQSDLQPKPHSLSAHVNFAASAVAADHVGGDFYDIFEAESGKITIVLGDVSGKGVPAALLVSVLQGAIRSSTASQHEFACEQINRMLCERTSRERFATLFWGVFDPITRTLRYVNAGHAAPMLARNGQNRVEDEPAFLSEAKTAVIRLDEGGPILGFLPNARYSAGMVEIEDSDTLILYSDGITEAANQNKEEFGEQRIEHTMVNTADASPAEICQRILNQVIAFADAEVAPDDRTLVVIKFPRAEAALRERMSMDTSVGAVA